MGIKVEIKDTEKRAIEFPALMQDVKSSLIVLATDEQTGVVVNQGLCWGLGQFRTDWAYFDDSACWKPYKGTITLSNE